MSRNADMLELVRRAKAGDTWAFDKLLKDIEPELRKFLEKLYIQGSDREDVLQEGRLGIWKAVSDFNADFERDGNGGLSFKNFAMLCVRRRLITAISTARRKKYHLQNTAVSLERPISTEDEGEQTLKDFIEDDSVNTLSKILDEECFQEIFDEIARNLTQLEMAVFMEFVYHEESYNTIAKSVGCSYKCVDNAMMRVRKKARPVIIEWKERQRKNGVDSG